MLMHVGSVLKGTNILPFSGTKQALVTTYFVLMCFILSEELLFKGRIQGK